MRRVLVACLAVFGVFLLRGAAEADGPFSFFSVTPCRIVDTRGATGITGGPILAAGQPRNFPIHNYCGVPTTATVAVLNVTITQPAAEGHLTIWRYGTPQPLVSNMNFVLGAPALANGAVVSLTAGSFQVSVVSAATVHVIIDVTGYFRAPGGNYYTVTPCRLLDTRPGGSPISATPRVIRVPPSCGVPYSARAVVGNLTAVQPSAAGTLNLYPNSPTPPDTGTLPYRAGITRANNFVMPLSGTWDLALKATSSVHALIDIVGYFTFARSNCPAANPLDTIPDDAAIQACLDLGGLVTLDPGNPGYLIAQGLVLSRDGTTLMSAQPGSPGRRARLAAASSLGPPILRAGGRRDFSIFWIEFDGNRPSRTLPQPGTPCAFGAHKPENVSLGGDAGVFTDATNFKFNDNRSTRTLCGTGLFIHGRDFEVARNTVDDNGAGLEDPNNNGFWADGITLGKCINGNVHDNQVIDATDIGIVGGGGQNCKIENNFVNAYNRHVFAGIAMHVFCFPVSCGDYTGGTVSGNTIVASYNRMGFGLSLGMHPWGVPPDTRTIGGTVSNNNVSGAVVNVAVDGSNGITVVGNTIGAAQGTPLCGLGGPTPYAVNSAHTLSSTLQAGWVGRSYDNCIP